MTVHLQSPREARPSPTGAEDLEDLARMRAMLTLARTVLQKGFEGSDATPALRARVNATAAHFRRLSETANDLVRQGKSAQDKLRSACLAIQMKFGVSRRPDKPDPFSTAAVAMISTSLETLATFAILFGSGASIAEAAGFGITFAATGTALSQLAGYHGLRRTNFRMQPEYDRQSDVPRKRRRKGRRIVVVCSVLTGLLVWTAARLRATGSLEQTWDFSEVGFLETFSHGMAAALLGLALVTTAINVWAGLRGYADRIYDFENPFQALDAHADALLEQLDGVQDQVTDLAERAIEALYEQRDLFEDFLENPPETAELLRSEILDHNIDVQSAMERELGFQFSNNKLRLLEGKAQLLTGQIEEAFNKLIIPEEQSYIDDSALDHARACITATDLLIAEIEAAEAESLAMIELKAAECDPNRCAVLSTQVLQ